MLLRRPRHPPNVAFVQWHFSHIALIRRHVRSLAEADIRPWTAIRVLTHTGHWNGWPVVKSFGHLLTDPREFDNCAVRSRHGRTIPLAYEEMCLVLSRPDCRGRYACTD